jgi:hypothetical protein
MVSATDIIGWAMEDGYMLCPSCYEELDDEEKEHGSPEFAGAEVDFPGSSCDNCLERIENESLLFNDGDIKFVERVDSDASSDSYTSRVMYKLHSKELGEYMDTIVDMITAIEKINEVGDSDYEERDSDTYVTVWF